MMMQSVQTGDINFNVLEITGFDVEFDPVQVERRIEPLESASEYARVSEGIDIERIVDQVENRVTQRLRKDIILANLCRWCVRLCCHVVIFIVAYFSIVFCHISLPVLGGNPLMPSLLIQVVYFISVYIIIRTSVMCCNKVDSFVTAR
jgi:hypothetical protein